MRQLNSVDLETRCVRDLGFDPAAFKLVSRELLSAALRRAASLLCPVEAYSLKQAVLTPLKGVVVDEKLAEEAEKLVADNKNNNQVIVEPDEVVENGA